MTESASRYRLADAVAAETIGDEMVLLNTTSGQYFELNGTGARIVQLIQDLQWLDAVAEKMAEEFEADDERLNKDINQLSEELLRQGLLVEI